MFDDFIFSVLRREQFEWASPDLYRTVLLSDAVLDVISRSDSFCTMCDCGKFKLENVEFRESASVRSSRKKLCVSLFFFWTSLKQRHKTGRSSMQCMVVCMPLGELGRSESDISGW